MAGEVRFNYAGSRVLVTGGSNGIGWQLPKPMRVLVLR
jgi:short-subunit dehydrogenase involved in D-alanine esterification of teichoic acids